jgi:hypothetical protein
MADLYKEPESVKLFVVEDTITLESVEDGGQAMIDEAISFDTLNSNDDNFMFVNIQSWDEDTEHTDMINLIGKKVRITIEVLED